MAESAKTTLSVVDGGMPDRLPASVKASRVSYGGGGGSGGGPTLDTETKNYVDANMRAVDAENNASFARLEAKIEAIHPGATWQQNAGIAFVAVTAALSILAYASDRFDSGVSAMGAIEEALDLQRETNAAQDARLNLIIDAMEEQNAQPQASP